MPISSVGNSRGITLIELLVVVAIIGVIAGVSFPSVSAGMEGIRLTTASDSIASFLNSASNRAIRREQVIEVAISRKENTLWMYSSEPGFEKKLEMPDGVAIQAIYPALTDEGEGPRRFLILPGSSAPRIGVQVVNRKGNARLVQLDPMTGFPHVERVK
jgi:prepilin-type N-terminal cleavage/methylation domain-containing protein